MLKNQVGNNGGKMSVETNNQTPTQVDILLFDVMGVLESVKRLLTRETGKEMTAVYVGHNIQELPARYGRSYYAHEITYMPVDVVDEFIANNKHKDWKKADQSLEIPVDKKLAGFELINHKYGDIVAGVPSRANDNLIVIDCPEEHKKCVSDFVEYLYRTQEQKGKNLGIEEINQALEEFLTPDAKVRSLRDTVTGLQ